MTPEARAARLALIRERHETLMGMTALLRAAWRSK